MGVLVGLLNAVSVASLFAFLKKLTGVSPNFLTWVRVTAALPILAAVVTLFSDWTLPPVEFWLLAVAVITPLEIIFAWLGTKALHLSPISIIAPLGAATSIFLVPVGFVFLGELPTLVGLVGVVAIFIGSFLLGWRRGESAVLGLKNVLRERGSWLALTGALLASISISVTKISFRYASPLLAAFYIDTLMALTLIPFFFVYIKQVQLHTRHSKYLAGVGLLSGAGITLHHIGIAILPVAYYISIKRLSTLIDVLFGRVFFHENHIRERFIGAVLMFAGIVLIALG